MNLKIIACLTSIGYLTSIYTIQAMDTSKKNYEIADKGAQQEQTGKSGVSPFITEYAKAYGATYFFTFAHEAGHWLAIRVLLKINSAIWINPLQFLPLNGACYPNLLDSSYRHIVDSVIKEIKQQPRKIFNTVAIIGELPGRHITVTPKQWVIIGAAGPLSGFAGCYALLKANTFLTEYNRNGKQLVKAWEHTWQKSLFNNDQNPFLQCITVFSIVNDWANLYPWGGTENCDGDRIFNALKIANRRPMLRTCTGFGTSYLLGITLAISVLDGWTKNDFSSWLRKSIYRGLSLNQKDHIDKK